MNNLPTGLKSEPPRPALVLPRRPCKTKAGGISIKCATCDAPFSYYYEGKHWKCWLHLSAPRKKEYSMTIIPLISQRLEAEGISISHAGRRARLNPYQITRYIQNPKGDVAFNVIHALMRTLNISGAELDKLPPQPTRMDRCRDLG